MSNTVTLGGDRLGAGKKLKVHLHGYERSSHDLGYLWRSTMSAGTLVPFMSEVALPGDTFDINLDCDMKTHPTVGPLFGSYKVQLDVFLAPIRLYQGKLHNNVLGVGMNMASIKLPLLRLKATDINPAAGVPQDLDNSQINPSCVLAYLGIRGVGDPEAVGGRDRDFNAVPLLAYWEIYKNYYANKQEEIGAVIHRSIEAQNQTVSQILITTNGIGLELEAAPGTSPIMINETSVITVYYFGARPSEDDIMITVAGGAKNALAYYRNQGTVTEITGGYEIRDLQNGPDTLLEWSYRQATDVSELTPLVATFPLENIDTMRNEILAHSLNATAFNITTAIGTTTLTPYSWLTEGNNTGRNMMGTQEGLAIKTYQSDLFNNWLSTEWIDGAGGITQLTAIDTTGGEFTLDTLNLAKKVYNMLNRIAVSGGSYNDWIDATYDHEKMRMAESPMYMGGLIKELVFQEVISNAGGGEGENALGTLGGRGVLGQKHKGGYVHVSVDEPSYIIGIVSLTPRVDYSQGNKWDVHLKTMDDLHKPALDEIGFQELITEQMAWWDTRYNTTNAAWEQKSAGKQPAWLNYMTNVNRVYGNFAIPDNEMFMVLNRRYESELVSTNWQIADLTTYIDPVKFNHIFADTSIDAQNFWAQIAVDITARRKMSAKVMPNL